MYDDLHRYWQGLGEADNPLKEAWREWALGSAAFIKRTLALAASGDEPQRQRTSCRFNAVTVSEIIAVAAAHDKPDLTPQKPTGNLDTAFGSPRN